MESYQYIESGLNNIYLINGFEHHHTPYGEGVSIHNVQELNRIIGEALIQRSSALNGAELRFLRLEMDQTQRDLAGILGATEQTLRLWEKGRVKPLPGSADRLLRVLYNEFIGGDGEVRRMLVRLAELDLKDASPLHLREERNVWCVAI